MRKFFPISVFAFLPLLFSCGNDPVVESNYVSAMEKGIEQLKKSVDVAGLVRAQEIEDSAKSLPGVLDLSKSKVIKDVEERFNAALDSAHTRIMDSLEKESFETPEM